MIKKQFIFNKPKILSMSKSTTGFTLIEILVSSSILLFLAVIATFSFSDMNKKESIDKGVLNVVSFFNEARSLAMSSQDFSDYGVHLSTSSLISFKGNDFNSGVNKKEYILNNPLELSYSLSGSSTDVIFKKVTGETDTSGLINLFSSSKPEEIKIIKIYNTGVVEIN